MDKHLNDLATFACQRELAAFDAAAVERAKWVILDSLTAIAAGMRVPEMSALREATLRGAAPGRCWLVGTGRRTNAADAALLNGTAGTWLELNEGCLIAKGHPGIQVVPAALAAAQELNATGEALVRAVLMGYEVSARIGRAWGMRLAVHPHGTYGAIGAAVAVGVLKGFSAEAMSRLINVASTLGLATSRRTLLEGATVRNIYTGHSGSMGLLAARMVECGFTGEANGVQSVYGNVLGDSFDSPSLTRDLGQQWLINAGYFKMHCTGRYIHSAIDALDEALLTAPGGRVAARDVKRVVVRTFKLAAMLNGAEIDSSFGARFSIPFAIATIIHHGESTLEAFDEAAVANPDVQALCRRVDMSEEAEFTKAYPDKQICEIRLEMVDGTEYTGHCEVMRGEAANPYRDGQVREKFFKLAIPGWGEARATELVTRFTRLEDIPAFGDFAADFDL
ncbi:MmgE/PrpD family protein [Ottowia thiooxydans]|uniref:MmgE/PrpD family protein n=1 Tax=Ottowia thiooxydans TaxID=219182 RepID=UPI0004280351|nr:MmgE/PrpD family protein [Ottowia thiooxydans]